jgi:ribA/ribD-fused uncharacterized protein
MMYNKAVMFSDHFAADEILNSPQAHPSEHRRLGRMVRNFDASVWDNESVRVVTVASTLKFARGTRLGNLLASTQGKVLVEASPHDRVWGIGFSEQYAIANVTSWGRNKLGTALMKVRAELSGRADSCISLSQPRSPVCAAVGCLCNSIPHV